MQHARARTHTHTQTSTRLVSSVRGQPVSKHSTSGERDARGGPQTPGHYHRLALLGPRPQQRGSARGVAYAGRPGRAGPRRAAPHRTTVTKPRARRPASPRAWAGPPWPGKGRRRPAGRRGPAFRPAPAPAWYSHTHSSTTYA